MISYAIETKYLSTYMYYIQCNLWVHPNKLFYSGKMKRRHSDRLIDKPTKTIKMENDDGKRIYKTEKAANALSLIHI